MPQMTPEQSNAIVEARRVMFRSFEERWPDEAASLYAAACSGGLLDVLVGQDVSPALLMLLNRQLSGTPFQLTRKRG
jgi:hypothetical protein